MKKAHLAKMEGTRTADLNLPPPTDPSDIAQLWSLARESIMPPDSPRRSARIAQQRQLREGAHQSRKRQSAGTAPAHSKKQKHSGSVNFAANTSASGQLEITTSAGSELTVRDANFRAKAMKPANVEVICGEECRYENHFGLSEEDRAPIPGQIEFYQRIPDLDVNNIWVDATDHFCKAMAKEIRAIVRDEDNSEPEYERDYARIFLFELRDPDVEKDQKVRTEATPQGQMSPDVEDLFTIPPTLSPDENTRQFKYKIRPDLVYWLSLIGFSPAYANGLKQFAHVRGSRKFSPYCSIEYEKESKGPAGKGATNQMASSALIALWNRFGLRKRAVEAEERAWKEEDKKDLRHYGIRVMQDEFDIWVMTPRVSDQGEWEGAQLQRLRRNDLGVWTGVRVLSVWINEIHRYGLTTHTKGVLEDVRICAEKKGLRLGETVI